MNLYSYEKHEIIEDWIAGVDRLLSGVDVGSTDGGDGLE